MSSMVTSRLEAAAEQAQSLVMEITGQDLDFVVETVVANEGSLFAEVDASSDGHCRIAISEDTLSLIDTLWRDVRLTPILTDDTGEPLLNDAGMDGLADRSLCWLILHELMHYRLRHIDLLGRLNLVEVQRTASSAEDEQDNIIQELKTGLTEAEQGKLRLCLELQADGDAIDIFLGLYSRDGWPELRRDAACIFVMMALIERQSRITGLSDITHPMAETRFFCLMAHLFQMWLYPGSELIAGEGESIVRRDVQPEPDEFEAYAQAVLVPIVNDAIQIATWADAESFLTDMGDQGALFQDIAEIQYAETLSADELQTKAARQWLALMPINEKIMAATGLRA